MTFYLGKRPQGDLIMFQSAHTPTRQNTDPRFVSAIGPFASELGASYYARYGQDNPALRTCADAERLMRTLSYKSTFSPSLLIRPRSALIVTGGFLA